MTQDLRQTIRNARLLNERDALAALSSYAPNAAQRRQIEARAADLVRELRAAGDPGLMEIFLAEYGLSTEEGVALMCLAEALLRVPDAPTMDALIEDKIAPGAWGRHLGQSASSLVNASTWALMLTGTVLHEAERPSFAGVLRGAVKRLGEPVIRSAVARAMKELGRQFILGETIDGAMKRAAQDPGVGHSYDMLGEAALTQHDADTYFEAYSDAIARIGSQEMDAAAIGADAGISIKLSALHPRYEALQHRRVMAELVERVTALAKAAAQAGIGFTIDAEEADRLDLSLDVIGRVMADPALSGWDGFGMVVQAYGQRAAPVVDWFAQTAKDLRRKVNVRLVKGAYWDTEIKRAQVQGLGGYPVYTRKAATDVSYISIASKMLGGTDHVFAQFATHNAHSMAAILEMGSDRSRFEFQRLHGMGEALHKYVQTRENTRHRVYAPVGTHRDLLAYLVRRLLENGANSSFVNQIADGSIPPEAVGADPFQSLDLGAAQSSGHVGTPSEIFEPERTNSSGWDISAKDEMATIDEERAPFKKATWTARSIAAVSLAEDPPRAVENPAVPADRVGEAIWCRENAVADAVGAARVWAASGAERRRVLNAAADAFEANKGEIFALLAREAGKTIIDAIAELREAVDFLRYYGARTEDSDEDPRGTVVAISPWNFPLAIFTGQIAAGLAAGNGVLAKPAESTSLIAFRAVEMMHSAGVPKESLQLILGDGTVGRALLDHDLDGVVFTGSTATAQAINAQTASSMSPDAMFVAETGGLNAMIVDSTALPEQAVRDIVASAFQSAGQRCSALRVLYLQEDIYEPMVRMIMGAMDELSVAPPWALSTDVGPIIDAAAKTKIMGHIESNRARVLHQVSVPEEGHFVPPSLLSIDGISNLSEEIFGPVLHVCSYAAEEIEDVIEEINQTGYGLTFGFHSRIDARVTQVTERVRAGNIYVNRNQIGAIVGSQPFGGEGLSGTGPKAGGPHYVDRFRKIMRPDLPVVGAATAKAVDTVQIQQALDGAMAESDVTRTIDLPGPTGESNRLSELGCGVVLCLGPTAAAARAQAEHVRAAGAHPVLIAPDLGQGEGICALLHPDQLETLSGFHLVADWSDAKRQTAIRKALARREGAIVLLSCGDDLPRLARKERHLSIDTTAAGGNAQLLASIGR